MSRPTAPLRTSKRAGTSWTAVLGCTANGETTGGFQRWLTPAVLLIGLVAGIVFRLRLFLMDRSLWLDPAMLAVNIVEKSYGDLLGPLGLNQAAPAGFLVVSKLVGSLFDYRDISLTIVPLLFGLGALLLFLRLSCTMLDPEAAPLAFLPFAACPTAVFYSAEFKQYSGDLFFSVLILWAAHHALEHALDRESLLGFLAAGLFGALFSHPSVLVTAGTGLALALHALRHHREALRSLISIGAALAFLSGALYLFQTRRVVNRVMFTAHAKGFAPPPLDGKGFLAWWWHATERFVRFPLGLGRLELLVLAAMLGGVLAILFARRYRATGMLLLTPLLVTAIASTLHLYPILTGGYIVRTRFVLFAVPFGLLLLAIGIEATARLTPRPSVVVAGLILVLAWGSFRAMIPWPNIFVREEMRPLVERLQRSRRPEDTVFVYCPATAAFRFYTRRHPIPFIWVGQNLEPRSVDPRLLERAKRSPRLWLVVSHDWKGNRKALLRELEARGTGFQRFTFPGAWLYTVVQHPAGPRGPDRDRTKDHVTAGTPRDAAVP